jgi:hypothetical protein
LVRGLLRRGIPESFTAALALSLWKIFLSFVTPGAESFTLDLFFMVWKKPRQAKPWGTTSYLGCIFYNG